MTIYLPIRIPDALEESIGANPMQLVAKQHGWVSQELNGDPAQFYRDNVLVPNLVRELKKGIAQHLNEQKIQIEQSVDATIAALPNVEVTIESE